jgi:hypothetical protein
MQPRLTPSQLQTMRAVVNSIDVEKRSVLLERLSSALSRASGGRQPSDELFSNTMSGLMQPVEDDD